MSRFRRLALLPGVAMLIAGLTTAGSGPAHGADELTMRLVSQSLTVAPDTDTTIVFEVDGPIPPDATVVVQAYTRIETRGQVRNAIDRGPEGTVVAGGRIEYVPTQLVPTGSAYSLVVGVQTGRENRDRLRLANPGLYPLTIEILVDDEPIGALFTFIERTGETPPTAIVQTAIALEVDSPPTLLADGSTEVPTEARAAVDELIETMNATSAPLTVSVRPELLDGLSRSSSPADLDRLARLTAALASRELLPDTYVALDPTTSVRADLGNEFNDQLLLGEDALRATLGIGTARRTWWVRDPIDRSGVELLRSKGFGQLLVGETIRSDLPRRDGELGTPSGTDGGVMPSLMSDIAVQARLTGRTDDPVLAAHHVVADLMAMSLEAEARALEDDRPPDVLGVLVDGSELDDSARAVLRNVLTLLPGTTRVELETASEVIDRLYGDTRDAELDRFSMNEPADETEAIETATTISRLRAAIGSTTTMLPERSPDPERWRAMVAVLPAGNLTAEARDDFIRQLDGEIGELRGCISVLTSGQVSLGSRVSQVPLTLLNKCSTPLTVRVRLSSPKLRLSQPDTVAEVIDRYPFEIPVEARTNGVFVVTVELLTPGGEPMAQLSRPVTFTVEATALTGLGQVISGALLVVLATWWISHGIRRRRIGRADAAEPFVPSHPAAGSAAEPHSVPPGDAK